MTLSYGSDSLRILLVDDELCILQILGELLRSDGHTVGLATNGLSALQHFSREPWDVILTDRAMPGMGGEELAQRIKMLSPSTPVIMITGFASRASYRDVDAVLPKPFSREAIAAAISQTLRKTSSARPYRVMKPVFPRPRRSRLHVGPHVEVCAGLS